jgi:hypothetical protein
MIVEVALWETTMEMHCVLTPSRHFVECSPLTAGCDCCDIFFCSLGWRSQKRSTVPLTPLYCMWYCVMSMEGTIMIVEPIIECVWYGMVWYGMVPTICTILDHAHANNNFFLL